MPRIIAISDTHGQWGALRDLPDGDVLVHAGDWTAYSDEGSIRAFLIWFESQPHEHKVFIAGNHETWVEANPDLFVRLHAEHAPSCHYLNDSGVTVASLKVWGSPVQPRFLDWSFNRDRGPDIQRHWDMIPSDTEVLITHGPVAGHHDGMPADIWRQRPERLGCMNLRQTIETRLKDLRLHTSGHIHLHGGKTEVENGVVYVNASVVDESYTYAHPPVTIDL